MRYEHLIQINDPFNLLLLSMTRAQVWTGLMQRVHAPQRFPLGPTECEVTEGPDPHTLHRRVSFGSLVIHDTVSIEPLRSLRFTPEARPDMPVVTLSIVLEQHPADDEQALFLRFVYASEVEDPDTDGYRQQAWLQNDRDMVRTVRQWHESGLL